MEYLIPIILALPFRFGGSTFNIFGSEQLTRLFVRCAPWGVCLFYLTGGGWWYPIVYTALFYFGIAIAEFGSYRDLRDVGDWVSCTFRGILITLFAGYSVNFFGHYPFGLVVMLSGAMFSLGNYFGNITPSKIPNLNQGNEMGDIYTGLLVGLLWILLK